MSPSSNQAGALLITGATGFIGRRLVTEALARGLQVRVLVRDRATAEQLGPVDVFVGDLEDPASLAGIERGVSHVVHGAGILGKWGTPESRLESVNVGGSRALLERFSEAEVERYLHLSAGGVTGPVAATAVDETYDCRPATAYERTKWRAERVALEFAARGCPVAVARPTFTYGPGDPHKLPLFRAILRGRYAFIDGGRSVLHPVFIEDLVRGILLALARAQTGEVYILGGPRPVTKRELVTTIAEALGARAPRLGLPRGAAWLAATLLEPVGRRLGFEPILTRSRVMMMADNFGYFVDKARRELGFEPQVELRKGIAATVAAYREEGLL